MPLNHVLDKVSHKTRNGNGSMKILIGEFPPLNYKSWDSLVGSPDPHLASPLIYWSLWACTGEPVGVSAWQGFCLAPAAASGLEQSGRWQGQGRARRDPSSQVREGSRMPCALGVGPRRWGLVQGHPAVWGGGGAGRSRAR